MQLRKQLVTGLLIASSAFMAGYDWGHHSVYTPKDDNTTFNVINRYKQALEKRDSLLEELFGKRPSDTWLSMPATITWYSLSVDETNADPDTAAHGKSRPFMAAISMKVVRSMDLIPGDKLAVVSDDGRVAAIVVYWDQKNARYDDGNWIDIVAPSKKVAKRWSIRPGKIIKI